MADEQDRSIDLRKPMFVLAGRVAIWAASILAIPALVAAASTYFSVRSLEVSIAEMKGSVSQKASAEWVSKQSADLEALKSWRADHEIRQIETLSGIDRKLDRLCLAAKVRCQ